MQQATAQAQFGWSEFVNGLADRYTKIKVAQASQPVTVYTSPVTGNLTAEGKTDTSAGILDGINPLYIAGGLAAVAVLFFWLKK